MNDRERTEIWLEKRGGGPLPHYRVVRRKTVSAAGRMSVAVGFVFVAIFPQFLEELVVAVILGAVAVGVYQAR